VGFHVPLLRSSERERTFLAPLDGSLGGRLPSGDERAERWSRRATGSPLGR
jgi:hypothetical protein